MKYRFDSLIPFVSIIIPTYHDWERLLLCIDALKKQTYPSEYFEVIIINNDPADKSQDLDILDSWKLIAEDKPGSYAARNAGIKKSRGEILAFTDADCVPSPDWIEKGVSLLSSDPEIKRVAGRIDLFFKNEKLNPAEIYEKVFAFPQRESASNGYSTTANMFTYKTVFDTVGLFNDSMMSGGDVEWGCRANMMGFKIAYGRDCIVGHPARDKISELTRKIKRISGGNLVIDRISGKRPYWFFLDLLPPIIWAINVTRDSHLQIREKFIAFVTLYLLNLHRFWYKMLISLGFAKAPRE